MQITSKSFWLPLNQSSPNSVVDAISNASISIPQGSAVAINCAAFRGDTSVAGNMVNDLSNITSATINIFKNSATGALLYSGTVAFADFHNPACSFANWNTQQDFQFGFQLTSDETNWALGGGWNGAIWFSIEVLTAAGPVPIGIGTGNVFATGNTAGPTVVNNPIYLSAAQIAATYLSLSQLGIQIPMFLPAISSLVGGAADNLDSIATVNLAVGTIIQWDDPILGIQTYRIVSDASVLASVLPGILLPVDHNSITNPKYWLKR